jgi:hypothetical protein
MDLVDRRQSEFSSDSAYIFCHPKSTYLNRSDLPSHFCIYIQPTQ